MDLVRRILERAEESTYPLGAQELVEAPHTFQEVVYHIRIMREAGLVDAKVADDLSGNSDATVYGLSWDGQEFLSVVRSDGIWARAKREVREKTGSLSFEVLRSVAVDVCKSLVLG